MRGKFTINGTFRLQSDDVSGALEALAAEGEAVEGEEPELRLHAEEAELSLDVDWGKAEGLAETAAAGKPPLSAAVTMGSSECETPFPPPPKPGRESELIPGMVPYRVLIARGGSVTFDIAPYVQVAIYEPGTNLKDIEVSPATLKDVTFGPFTITNYRINDPNRRVALSPRQTQSGLTWTTPAGTFESPGGYLVISTSTPHFAFGHAHGWVIVR